MTEEPNKCPICGIQDPEVEKWRLDRRDAYGVRCPNCGENKVTEPATIELHRLQPDPRGLVAGVLAERFLQGLPGVLVCSSGFNRQGHELGEFLTVEQILRFHAPHSLRERRERTLLNFARRSDAIGTPILIRPNRGAICFAGSLEALTFMLADLSDRRWIHGYSNRVLPANVIVAPFGWDRIDELEKRAGESTQVFVAMSFHKSMAEAWHSGIQPAVDAAGYRPLRIDMKEHNEKICDLILAEIRKSAFIVADVTLQRQGVYFEAGFALGLGLPVIWTCREDDSENCHFDTRQYNHIRWGAPNDLKVKLQRRIDGTIGRRAAVTSRSPRSE